MLLRSLSKRLALRSSSSKFIFESKQEGRRKAAFLLVCPTALSHSWEESPRRLLRLNVRSEESPDPGAITTPFDTVLSALLR